MRFRAAAPFHAARRKETFPEGHPCRNLHGHTFTGWATADLPDGWTDPGCTVADFATTVGAAIKPLDYSFLNESVTIPTDENIALHLAARLSAVPGLARTGVQSTTHQGVDLAMGFNGVADLHVWRRFRFEAAHQLPNVPAGHQCGRMHGHGFEVIIHCRQPLAPGQDIGVTYETITAVWQPLFVQLDHNCLNDILGLENPTSETLSAWCYRQLAGLEGLWCVSVYETTTAGCIFDGSTYRIWKDRPFEAATCIADAPEGTTVRRLHGHSYLLRLSLTAPLDQVLAWTVDYGDVKRLFAPTYDALDHHRLDEIPGIDGSTTSVTTWAFAQAKSVLPQLDRLDIYERPGIGVQLGNMGGPSLPV